MQHRLEDLRPSPSLSKTFSSQRTDGRAANVSLSTSTSCVTSFWVSVRVTVAPCATRVPIGTESVVAVVPCEWACEGWFVLVIDVVCDEASVPVISSLLSFIVMSSHQPIRRCDTCRNGGPFSIFFNSSDVCSKVQQGHCANDCIHHNTLFVLGTTYARTFLSRMLRNYLGKTERR